VEVNRCLSLGLDLLYPRPPEMALEKALKSMFLPLANFLSKVVWNGVNDLVQAVLEPGKANFLLLGYGSMRCNAPMTLHLLMMLKAVFWG